MGFNVRPRIYALAALICFIIGFIISMYFFVGSLDHIIHPDATVGIIVLSGVLTFVFSFAAVWNHIKPKCKCQEITPAKLELVALNSPTNTIAAL